MRLLANKTLIALVGAVALPVAGLSYLASLPDRARGSRLAILLNVAIVLVAVVLFALFLGRLVEQRIASRVRNWLDTDEGRTWLDDLPAEERDEFLGRLAEKSPGGALDPGPVSRVDGEDDPR